VTVYYNNNSNCNRNYEDKFFDAGRRSVQLIPAKLKEGHTEACISILIVE
jgi:hypothetical protein